MWHLGGGLLVYERIKDVEKENRKEYIIRFKKRKGKRKKIS